METASSLDKLKGLKNEELRVILKRNGQPTSGKKCDLVLRCHMLFQKKRNENPEKIEVVEHEKPLINVVSNVKSNEGLTYDQLLCEGSQCQWSKDLRTLPPFNLVQLYEYLVIKTTKYNHSSIQTSAYKKLKAYQFFKEGHIKDLQVGCPSNIVYVKAEVLASMKQAKYKAIISFSQLGYVLKAACTCPAG